MSTECSLSWSPMGLWPPSTHPSAVSLDLCGAAATCDGCPNSSLTFIAPSLITSADCAAQTRLRHVSSICTSTITPAPASRLQPRSPSSHPTTVTGVSSTIWMWQTCGPGMSPSHSQPGTSNSPHLCSSHWCTALRADRPQPHHPLNDAFTLLRLKVSKSQRWI